jgi:hypothetical protein
MLNTIIVFHVHSMVKYAILQHFVTELVTLVIFHVFSSPFYATGKQFGGV